MEIHKGNWIVKLHEWIMYLHKWIMGFHKWIVELHKEIMSFYPNDYANRGWIVHRLNRTEVKVQCVHV